MELTELQKREMSKLLDKYESRRDYGKIQVNNRRTMLRINARNYPDYFHISDASFRRRFNMEMRELERRGWVKLEWEEFERNQTLKRVILNTEELPSIYRELGREAKRDRYHRLQELVLQWQESAPEALQPFYRDLLERLSAYETLPPGLNSLKGLEDWSQLFRALNALLELKQEVPKRRFSVKLFGDSKRWDQLEKPVLWVLRNYCLSPEDQELEDEEIFSELGLLDNPGHINIAGPLQFRTPRGEINLFSFYPDLGLAPQMVEDLEITGLEAKAVVTVENLTSFYHYVDEGPADHLVIYLGGYHNRQRRQFLRKIYDFACRYRRDIAFYHWGDIDLGGFQIWQHLCRRTGISFQPLMMDEETFFAYEEYAQPFSSTYRQKLAALLEKEAYHPFHRLIRLMLEKGKRLEQEAVSKIRLPKQQ